MRECLSKAPMTFVTTRSAVMGRTPLPSVLTLIITLVGHQPDARATTINATSSSPADVQAAVNAAASGGGDTVQLPTCNYTSWNSTVTINKRLTIQGNGIANTVIHRAQVPSTYDALPMFRVNNVTGTV